MFKNVIRYVKHEKNCLESFAKNITGGTDATIAGVVGFIVVIVTLAIGLLIISGVFDAGSLESTDALYDTQQSFTNSTDSAYGMATVIPIVLAASLILGLLTSLVIKKRD